MSARIDWQAYLDGSLGAEERMLAERRLAEDPMARRELDSLRSFVGMVRSAARSEPVPMKRFEALIPRRRGNPLIRRTVLLAAPAIVFASVWLAMRSDPMRIDDTPSLGSIATHDPQEASEWARRRVGRQFPVLTLSGIGRMTEATCGDHWASYDYLVGGERYELTVSSSRAPFLDKPSVTVDGNRLFVGRGVGWVQKGFSFYLTGPREDVRESLACAAIREVDRQKLSSISTSAKESCRVPSMSG